MKRATESHRKQDQHEPTTHRVLLPGFIAEEDIGLGDVVEHVTSYFGLKPCGPCGRRAAALNRWVVFTRRRVVSRPRRA
jgi:hypothetical protein